MTKSGGKARPGLRAILQAFFEGFTSPSRIAFWAMLAGFLVNVFVAAWFFRYETLGSPAGAYLARSFKDSYAIATHRALALAQDTDTRPLLIVLGSSVTSSAFASETRIKAAVDAATGRDWKVAMLTTSLQGPLEQVALLDVALGNEAMRKREITVLLGVEAASGYWSRNLILDMSASVRLGLRSDWADAELARIGGTPLPRSSFYPIENREFIAINGGRAMMRLLSRTPVTPRHDYHAPATYRPTEARMNERRIIADEIRKAQANEDGEYLEILRNLAIRLSANRGLRLVLLPERPSPELVVTERLGGILAEEAAHYTLLAEDLGALCWQMFGTENIPQSAFHDDLHIGDPATQDRLAAALGSFLADEAAR